MARAEGLFPQPSGESETEPAVPSMEQARLPGLHLAPGAPGELLVFCGGFRPPLSLLSQLLVRGGSPVWIRGRGI